MKPPSEMQYMSAEVLSGLLDNLKDKFTSYEISVECEEDETKSNELLFYELVYLENIVLRQIKFWFDYIVCESSIQDDENDIKIATALGHIRKLLLLNYEILQLQGITHIEEHADDGSIIDRGEISFNDYVNSVFPLGSEKLAGNILINKGVYSLVKLHEKVRIVKDCKGIEYIEYLLARPNEKIAFLDLINAVEPNDESVFENQIKEKSVKFIHWNCGLSQR